MTLVIDASVAAKWVLPEEGSERAAALCDSEADLIAPSLAIAEVANAVWKRASADELTRKDARHAIQIASSLFTRLVPVEELAGPALGLCLRFRHAIYDCFYLALADRENAPLITADERQFALARRARIPARLL